MDINGYEVKAWSNATSGEIAIGIKNGKQYILKKYNVAYKPHEGCSAKLKAIKEKEFNRFIERRLQINRATASVKDPTVVCVSDSFVYENMLVEVSEFLTGVMDTGRVSRLPVDVKIEAIKSAFRAIALMHSATVIHSDIKPGNLLFVREGSAVSARVIDFDNSYMLSEKSTIKAIGGDNFYVAPEAQIAGPCGSPSREKLDLKSDVFSLALTLYEYFTGKKFDTGVKGVTEPWQVIIAGGKLKVGNEVPEPLRTIFEKMLEAEPNDRFSAREAYDIMCGTASVSAAIPSVSATSDASVPKTAPTASASAASAARGSGKLVDPDDGLPSDIPWPEDGIEFVPETFSAKGFVSVARKMDSVSRERYYKVETTRGFCRNLKKEQLTALGCARPATSAAAMPLKTATAVAPSKPAESVPDTKHHDHVADPSVARYATRCEVCEPWEGDPIEFDVDALTGFGFVKVERTSGDRKDYKLSYGKNVTVKSSKKCVEEGYAKPVVLAPPRSLAVKDCGENVLWEGDKGTIDPEVVKKLSIIRIVRCEVDGRKRYRIEAEKTSAYYNPEAVLDYSSLRMLGIIKD